MKRKLSMSSLLVAGALAWVTGYAGTSTESHPGVGMGEASQQKSQQGVGLEDFDSASVILGGPEILFGRIEKVEGDSYSIQGHDGEFMNLQLTKDSNIVCTSGSDAKLMTGRHDLQEHAEIPISPATEEQMSRHDSSRLDDQLSLLSDPNRPQTEYETPAPSKDPSTLKDVVGSTDEAGNKDVARGSGFVVGSSDCHFRPGDLVRIEASDMGRITTITRLPYEQEENSSQIATERDEELTTSRQ